MRTNLAVAGFWLLLGGVPLLAHHAFSAEFDADRPIELKGVVTKVEWINPHAWIHMDATRPDGTVEQWMVEAGTPNTLYRRGFTKDALTVGTEIAVDGYRAKDGSMRCNGRNVRLPDGRSLFLGSSGTGAPRDGKDPADKN